jgi:zinc/manganese transport system permease protein
VTRADVVRLGVIAVVALVTVAVIARPLVFATIDPDVATARGVPVRALAFGFLLLLGVAAAACTQITGSLLVLALLVLPPATAQTITTRPGAGLLLSAGLGVAVTWIALAVAYYSPYPVGFWLTSIAFALFVAARITAVVARGRGWRLA